MRIKTVPASQAAAWLNASLQFLRTADVSIWTPPVLLALILNLPYLANLFSIGIVFFLSAILIGYQSRTKTSLFAAFKDGIWRRLIPLFSVHFLFSLLLLTAISPALAPLMAAAEAGKELSRSELMPILNQLVDSMLWFIPAILVMNWLTFFYLPLASFTQQSGFAIFKYALSALFKNITALVLYSLLLIIFIFVLSIGLSLLTLIIKTVALYSALIGQILLILMHVGVTALLLAFLSANMLFAFRDVFQDDAPETNADDASEILL
jgi:hypothetical protein